jgi:hypothetical protein
MPENYYDFSPLKNLVARPVLIEPQFTYAIIRSSIEAKVISPSPALNSLSSRSPPLVWHSVHNL